MRITASHLCTLIGREYGWLDSRRRVARAHLAAGRHVDAAHTLPLSSYGPRDTFGAVDLLRVAIATEAERLGLDFAAGAALALSVDVEPVLNATPGDRTTWAWVIRDGAAVSYGSGTLGAYLSAYGIGAANAALVNVTDVWCRLRRRAAELAIDLHPQLRARLPDAIRPLRATL